MRRDECDGKWGSLRCTAQGVVTILTSSAGTFAKHPMRCMNHARKLKPSPNANVPILPRPSSAGEDPQPRQDAKIASRNINRFTDDEMVQTGSELETTDNIIMIIVVMMMMNRCDRS